MSTRKDDHLRISQYEDHAEIEVLQPVGVFWSFDGTLWHKLLDKSPVGTVHKDYNSPRGHELSYASTVSDRMMQHFYAQPLAVTFREMLRPWVGDDEP